MTRAIVSRYVDEFEETGKLQSIRVIDTHTHMDDVYGTALSVADIDGCVKILDDEQIEMIWCAPHGDMFDPLRANRSIESVMERYPDRVRGYFSYNPNYPEQYLPHMNRLLDLKGYIGMKFLPDYHRTAIEDGGYDEALAFCDKHGLAVLIHTWGGSRHNAPINMERLLERYHNARFIMGHAAPGECDRAIALAARYGNCYLDICDIHRNNGVIERMCDGCGSEKVLFGTDLPWYDPNYCIGSVLYAHITDVDRENIFRNNAIKLMREIGT